MAEAPQVGRSVVQVRGLPSAEMDFQLLRLLGATAYGGAAIGEALYSASVIGEGGPDDWVAAFTEAATALRGSAESARSAVTERDRLHRAHSYFRAAEYWAPDPTAMRTLGLSARDCFRRAAELESTRGWGCQVLEIPFEGTSMPGYLWEPAGATEDCWTIVMLNGSDGTSEENMYLAGFGALERGHRVISFDGPGQSGMRRDHPESVFRPDYEVPIAAALDHAIVDLGVPAERIAAFGASFGGYFVTRAAASDDRISAVIASPPLLDLDATLGALIRAGSDSAAFARTIEIHLWKFGVDNVSDLEREILRYSIDDDQLARVRVPALALAGAGEGSAFIGGVERYRRSVRGPVATHVFQPPSGGDAHCQVGNSAELCAIAWDWLAEIT